MPVPPALVREQLSRMAAQIVEFVTEVSGQELDKAISMMSKRQPLLIAGISFFGIGKLFQAG